MPFNAGSITSALGLDISEFSAGMIEAQGIMAIFPSAVTNFMVNPLLGVVGLLEQVAKYFVSTFSELTDAADHMNDLSQATGVGTDFLSAFGKVAETNGASVDQLAESYKFLGKNVSDALAGDKSALSAFERLGISAQQLQTSDLGNLMLKVADGIKGMSSADRIAASMSVLGRSGSDMIGTLSQGSAAIQSQIDMYRQLGDVVTAESAASADAWNDAVHDLQSAWEGVMMDIVDITRETLLPMLQEVLEWVKQHQPEFRQQIRDVANEIKNTAQEVQKLVSYLNTAFDILSKVKNAVGFGMSSNVLSGVLASGAAPSAAAAPAVPSGPPSYMTNAPGFGANMGLGTAPGEVNVNVYADHSQAASEIANKIAPQIKEKLDQVKQGQQEIQQRFLGMSLE